MKKIIIVILALVVVSIIGIGFYWSRQSKVIPAGGVINAVTFNCQDEKAIDAIFFKNRVELTLNDGRHWLLNQTISASGARYANEDESFVFWNKGDTAFITENGVTTFANCVLAENNQTGIAEQYFSQNFKKFVDNKTGITFEYPDQLLTKYISAVNWPPKAQDLNKPFACVETAKQIINGQDYCVTKTSEGAVGSIYTTYTYAFPYNNTTLTLNFTLRLVQCGNYDDPKKSECEQERTIFNPDNALDQIAQSLTFQIQ
ncbi:MAG: MliC family protein [Candidatus Paceibacterota bacterium]|jgi:membrane-bound inhibitor of C-type lysozyme